MMQDQVPQQRHEPSAPEPLDHLINAALDAIKRARAAWFVGIVITFVFAVAIFNAALSWNHSQVTRRAELYGASVEGIEGIRRLIASESKEEEQPFTGALLHAKGELGYLTPIWKACSAGSEIEPLRSALKADLDAHVNRRTAFDTVGLPILSVSVAGSDYGIVGGIALIIVGYWLLAMLRREHLALSEFVDIDDRTGRLVTGPMRFAPSMLVYACRRIRHYMVFSASERASPLRLVTDVSFVAAPSLLVINHLLTVSDVHTKGLGGYFQWHVLAEAGVAIVVIVVWIRALVYQHQTMKLMQYWTSECDREEPFRDFKSGA